MSATTTTILVPIFAATLFGAACAVTGHPAAPSELGRAATIDQVRVEAGPIELETVVAADWVVPLSGLLNLEHPEAVAAGLEDRDEPIHIAFHVVRHPDFGTFIVDTGVESAWVDPERDPIVGWLIRQVMNTEALDVHVDTASWLRDNGPVAGVFLTHMHLDHVMGLPDLPGSTPIYAGPGETAHSGFEGIFVRGTFDAALERFGPMREWQYAAGGGSGAFAGVVDIFGDGSMFALWAPGHTPGTTAFLVRTTEGPVLLLGDACHTAWGWTHGVEPGTFSYDREQSAGSLHELRTFAAAHPALRVVPGHQALPGPNAAR
jgi:glyoxylase-like metal-dependent hydrolase (beta-lactamase superfamily II)